MRPIIISAAAVLISLLSGCGGPVSTNLDAEPPAAAPPAAAPPAAERSDALDCRFQAARQAEMRYPRQPLDDPVIGSRRAPISPYDPAKGEAAQRFFNQCMAQKARLGPSGPAPNPAS
jgi:hypothetical protein